VLNYLRQFYIHWAMLVANINLDCLTLYFAFLQVAWLGERSPGAQDPGREGTDEDDEEADAIAALQASLDQLQIEKDTVPV
jgi:hypothetical protein